MPTKRNSSRSSSPRPSRSSRPSRRSKSGWSGQVIGTHASGGASTRKDRASSTSKPHVRKGSSFSPVARRSGSAASGKHAPRRRSATAVNKRSAEINQMEVRTTSVDQRTTAHASSRSRAQEFMKRRRRNNIIIAIVAIVAVVLLVFGIGSCAFRTFASGAMALNDDELKSELVAVEEGQPYNILLVGLSNPDSQRKAASFISVLRVDQQNKTFSLMSIPNSIMVSLEGGSQDLLRNSLRQGGEAQLVRSVKDATGMEFAHYLRITEDGLQKLVDDIGGVPINVQYRVDDPRVGHVVIPPGEQTLTGEQAVAFVAATNYPDGRTQRMNNQLELLFSLLDKLTSSEGLGWLNDSDVVSSAIKTDLSYDTLSALAGIYSDDATFYTASMPGSYYLANDVTCFAPSKTAWEQMRERFQAGEDTNTSADTSGVQKDQLSIVVQNGSGTDGLAAQAASMLESKGYNVQDTGNADSFVYTETLVVYKEEKDEAAAEAIVADLGIGRAVYASVYYNLKTDIQVVVGQDWKPVGR